MSAPKKKKTTKKKDDDAWLEAELTKLDGDKKKGKDAGDKPKKKKKKAAEDDLEAELAKMEKEAKGDKPKKKKKAAAADDDDAAAGDAKPKKKKKKKDADDDLEAELAKMEGDKPKKKKKKAAAADDDAAEAGDAKPKKKKKKAAAGDDDAAEAGDAKPKKKKKKAAAGDDDAAEAGDAKPKKKKKKAAAGDESPDKGKKSKKGAAQASTSAAPAPAADDDDEDDADDGYGDDDFEDYGDDFDDFDDDDDDDDEDEDLQKKPAAKPDPSVQALMQAIQSENEVAKSRSGTPAAGSATGGMTNRSMPGSGGGAGGAQAALPQRKFVAPKPQKNFEEKQLEKKRLERSKEILKYVALDFVSFDLLSIDPVSEYEVYLRKFGSSNAVQATTQFKDDEDVLAQEIQTDDIVTDTVGCQWPEDRVGKFASAAEESALKSVIGDMDTVRFSKFLRRAAQVCETLVEENADLAKGGGAGTKSGATTKSTVSVSSDFVHTPIPSWCGQRSVRSVVACQGQPNLFMVLYGPAKDPAGPRADENFIVLWKTTDMSKPHKILFCHPEPVCCCFPPDQGHMVFAGTASGSVLVWDLREADHQHRHEALDGTGVLSVMRAPTYATDYLIADNHTTPVVSIQAVGRPKEFPDLSADAPDSAPPAAPLGGIEDGSSPSSSFQVATIDERGMVFLWVVVELAQGDPAGSELDLGLAINGKVKVVKSIAVDMAKSWHAAALRTFDLEFSSSDTNHFLVGTDLGLVLQGARLGEAPAPKSFQTKSGDILNAVSVQFSPWHPDLFLAGYDDGSVRLFDTRLPQPIMTWHGFTKKSVIKVVWSPARPTVFFALDVSSRVFAWDLLQNDIAPVHDNKFQDARVVSFDLTAPVGDRLPACLVVGFANGDADLHLLKPELSARVDKEPSKLQAWLDHAV